MQLLTLHQPYNPNNHKFTHTAKYTTSNLQLSETASPAYLLETASTEDLSYKLSIVVSQRCERGGGPDGKSLRVNTSPYLIYYETFEPKDLTIELTDKDVNEVDWVTGNGQMVYWEECNVTYFVKDKKGNKDMGTKCPKRAGEIKVPSDIDLYCFGGKLRVVPVPP